MERNFYALGFFRQFLNCLLTYGPSKSKRLGKASKEALSHVGPDLSGNQNPPIATNQNHTQALGSKAANFPDKSGPTKAKLVLRYSPHRPEACPAGRCAKF